MLIDAKSSPYNNNLNGALVNRTDPVDVCQPLDKNNEMAVAEF